MRLYGGPEWRAHLVEDFAADASRLYLVRDVGDSMEIITGWADDGMPVVRNVDRYVALPDDVRGLLVPNSALQAIAERLRPDASGPEVRRLEEALKIERARVDRALDRSMTA